ncbi:MAG: hypothetical protein ABSF36_05010 [Candidatus Methanomethylicaceae archaeon]|jgi:hypothetical protein
MIKIHMQSLAKEPERLVKELVPKSFRRAGVLAIIAGLILIASGVISGSILLTALGVVNNYIGPIIGPADIVLQLATGALTYLIGFGGFLAILGGVLLLLKHGSAGRFLIGLGGGTAIFGLLFSMAEALYVTGISAPIFHQAYFGLYWIGAILATISIFLSRGEPGNKPII